MRKLLVLFLMVALIPFAVGCRVDGLWGYDDEDGPYYNPTPVVANPNIVRVAVSVPATSLASMKSALFGTNKNLLAAYIKIKTTGWVAMTSIINADGSVTFTYDTNDGRTLDVDANNKVQIKFTNGVDEKVYSIVAIVPTTTNAAAETKEYAVQVTFAAGDAVTVTPYTIAGTLTATTITLENGQTKLVYTFNFATGTPGTAVVVTPTSDSSTGFAQITSIEVAPDGTNYKPLSFNEALPTALGVDNLQNVAFRVTFATDMTNAEDAFKVVLDNMATTNTTEITKATSGLTVTYLNKVLTVVITRDVPLIADAKYKLTFAESSAKNAQNQAVLLPKSAFFRKGTFVSNWTGKAQAFAATQRVITLNLTGVAIKQQTLAGTVKLERFANAQATTPEATFVIDNAFATSVIDPVANTIVLTFNQDFVAGKTYKVTYVSGTWLNANNNPVEINAPITFQTLLP